ncbi:RHS repeat-associated core domain-containing protein, partial [Trinickia dinghuensis]
GTTTNFLYDGANAVQELAGGTPSANMLTGLGIDEVFSRTDSLGTRSFLTDALGSTVALTDGIGAIKTSYAYEPYGNATTSGETNTNAIQYAGRENDGTGLYYYRARYYHPGFSRFVGQDPIGLAGGNNLYAYVGGNPIGIRDPRGRDNPGMGPYGPGGGGQPCGGQSGNPNDPGNVAAKIIGGSIGTGAAMGAVFGGGYGLAAGVTEAMEMTTVVSAVSIGDAVATGAMAGAMIGGGAGALLGVAAGTVYFYVYTR